MPPSPNNNNNPYDDAALARALQEEYEKEYRRRGLEQHLGTTTSSNTGSLDYPASYTNDALPSAPTASEIFAQPYYGESSMESSNGRGAAAIPEPALPYTTSYMTQTTQTARTNRTSRQPPRQQRERNSRAEFGETQYHHQEHQHTTGTNANFQTTPMELSDEEVARRLEQELHDEELARQLTAQDQVHRSAGVARNIPPRTCCGKFCHLMRRFFSCVLGFVLITVSVVVVLYFMGILRGMPNFTPENFRAEDPFNNANPSDANLWRTKGQGLSLDVINALDSEWDTFFYTAVDEWDSGSPDTLKLSVTQGFPEKECRTVDGKVKVCNGDYGATNWRGINKVLLRNGWIYASAARMNDFYVRESDVNQKQYTMCHELGHAWGLPHTDENFYNKDLRNCMDYTNKPQNNMQPDAPNFDFLAKLYGTLDGSYVFSDGIYVTSRDAVPGNRELESLPSSILERVDAVDSLIDQGLISQETEGWRQLHAAKKGQAMEHALGEGYSLQVHMLFV